MHLIHKSFKAFCDRTKSLFQRLFQGGDVTAQIARSLLLLEHFALFGNPASNALVVRFQPLNVRFGKEFADCSAVCGDSTQCLKVRQRSNVQAKWTRFRRPDDRGSDELPFLSAPRGLAMPKLEFALGDPFVMATERNVHGGRS